jgi:hypothetical protein
MNVFVPGVSAGSQSAHLEQVLADSLRRAGFNVLDAATARRTLSREQLEGWTRCAFDTSVCPKPPPGVKLDLVVVARGLTGTIEMRSLRPDGHKLAQRYMNVASKWELDEDLEKSVLVWAKDLAIGANIRYVKPPPYKVYGSLGIVTGIVGLSVSGFLTWQASYNWWRLTSRGIAAPETLDVAYGFATSGQLSQIFAYATGIVGAVGLAVGLGFAYYLPGKRLELAPASPTLQVSVGPGGLMVQGAFP